MAVINTLREKMGKVVIGVIAFAIASFTLADILGPNSVLLGNAVTDVGEIAGQKISYEEYQQVVEQFAQNYAANFGRNPSEREMVTLRNQAWDLMIVEKAFQKEYDALGLKVGEEEHVDLVQGKNISPEILNAPIFADPSTGIFDRDLLAEFLATFGSQPPQVQAQWYNFENNLLESRLRLKYESLLSRTNFVTELEARRHYKEQASSADIEYVYVPFTSVPDSLFEVTDGELESYLADNSDQFKTTASRSIEFVRFPVVASADDSAYYEAEVRGMIEEFESVTDDSLYARINTDGFSYYNTYLPKAIPAYLQAQLGLLEEGKVYGPHQESNSYKIYKVVSINEDTMRSARASHILIGWEDESASAKQAARTEAMSILRQIQGGADFAEMAAQHGTDNTSTTGGDLGWFQSGDMVPPFQEAVFGAPKGLIPRLVETQFGYHIIEVTEPRVNSSYTVATIEQIITASDETIDEAYRRADYFAGSNVNLSEFRASAESDSLQIQQASNIGRDQSSIPGLGNARQIVRWLYTEANKNEVSEIFDLEDSYCVVVMTEEIEEGTSDLSTVRFRVERSVINEKKAEAISETLSGLSGTMQEIAEAYGEAASYYSTTGLLENAVSIPNLGNAPAAMGAIFARESGERTGPVQTPSGVVMFDVTTMARGADIADYATYKDQILTTRNGRVSYYTSEAIKDAANIKDERYRFY